MDISPPHSPRPRLGLSEVLPGFGSWFLWLEARPPHLIMYCRYSSFHVFNVPLEVINGCGHVLSNFRLHCLKLRLRTLRSSASALFSSSIITYNSLPSGRMSTFFALAAMHELWIWVGVDWSELPGGVLSHGSCRVRNAIVLVFLEFICHSHWHCTNTVFWWPIVTSKNFLG